MKEATVFASRDIRRYSKQLLMLLILSVLGAVLPRIQSALSQTIVTLDLNIVLTVIVQVFGRIVQYGLAILMVVVLFFMAKNHSSYRVSAYLRIAAVVLAVVLSVLQSQMPIPDSISLSEMSEEGFRHLMKSGFLQMMLLSPLISCICFVPQVLAYIREAKANADCTEAMGITDCGWRSTARAFRAFLIMGIVSFVLFVLVLCAVSVPAVPLDTMPIGISVVMLVVVLAATVGLTVALLVARILYWIKLTVTSGKLSKLAKERALTEQTAGAAAEEPLG